MIQARCELVGSISCTKYIIFPTILSFSWTWMPRFQIYHQQTLSHSSIYNRGEHRFMSWIRKCHVVTNDWIDDAGDFSSSKYNTVNIPSTHISRFYYQRQFVLSKSSLFNDKTSPIDLTLNCCTQLSQRLNGQDCNNISPFLNDYHSLFKAYKH